MRLPKVVVITGPTNVGKTKLGIELAKRLQTEIINGDAYQIYRGMNIGTAKPTAGEQQGITHHFLDILEPEETFSVYQYQAYVRTLIAQMHANQQLPIIVGGTGLYIDAVIRDYRFDEENALQQAAIEEKYTLRSNEVLYEELTHLVPEIAQKIHPNNRKRVIRSLELAQSAQQPIERAYGKELYYDAFIIFLEEDRETLYQRINDRVLQMINQGLVDEVKHIHQRLGPTAKMAIGYKELLPYLDGVETLDMAIEKIQKATRHYAKRQITWFKQKPDIHYLKIKSQQFAETGETAYAMVDEWYKKSSN